MNRAARRAAERTAGTVQAPPVLLMTVRALSDSDDGLVVEGSANDTGETDSYRTRFAFTDSCISESRGGIVLFNHDADNGIGRNLEMDMHRSHLWVRDVIDPGAVTPHGRSIPDLLRNKILRDFSIRFDNDATITFGREFDTITPNHLVEHSIVTLPSNRGSTMSDYMRSVLRNLERTDDGAEVARVFRIGFAASEGRAVVEPTSERQRNTPINYAQRDIGPLSFETLSNRLYYLIDALDYYGYPVAIYEDSVVYSSRGRLYRRSFTVDDAGEVTLLDDETEVLMTFQEANSGAAAATPEVRSEAPQADAPAPDPVVPAAPATTPDEPFTVVTSEGEMTLEELRVALLEENPLPTPDAPEPESDRPLTLEELQAGLVDEPETTPAP